MIEPDPVVEHSHSPNVPFIVHPMMLQFARSCRARRSRLQDLRHAYSWKHRLHNLNYPRRSRSSSHGPPEDFGDYSVILPPEPFVFGVSHITPRIVPEGIPRPPYASHTRSSQIEDEPSNGEPYEGDGRIDLGGVAESRVRDVAKLAKRVRNYAGTLVQVSYLHSQACSPGQLKSRRLG